MKKVFLLLFVFFTSIKLNAQVWCPPGATWYYDAIFINCDGYYKFEYQGDSLINSTNCKRIIQSVNMKCWWNTSYQVTVLDTLYMYADTDKVYYYRNNQFNLLYDFSVQVGDTLYVNGITKDWWGNSCDSVAKLKVDSIGTMTINSETLRYYCVQPLTNSPFSFAGRIVEKIGPIYKYPSSSGVYGINYFLPVKNDWCGMMMEEEHENGTFRCYYDDNFPVVSMTQYSCDYTLGDDDFENEESINFYPNPSSGILNISNENTKITDIKVFDNLGKLIVQINSPTNKINISHLENGIYFIEIVSGKGVVRKKIILSK